VVHNLLKENGNMVEERDPLTKLVIGAAIEVHRIMGPGLLESVYQKCLERDLKLQGIAFKPQEPLPIEYKDELIDEEFKIDFYFPNQLVVEIKAVEKMLPIHQAQLLTYLQLSKTRVGLLINFNVPVLKDGVKRMVR